MKRLAIVIVFCILTVMVYPAGAQAATTFSDTKTHWAKDYIATVANAGYVSGYYNGTFKPDSAVTRAEFTSVLIRCLGYQPTNGSSSFSDMKSHWAKGYVDKAVALGIIVPEDYGSNFNPNTALKRSEICGMLVRALGKDPDYSATGFKDSAAINKSVMRGYIKVACDLKLLSGYPNGNFEPFQEVTRAQMCKVVINFMSAQGKSLDGGSSTDVTDIDKNANSDTPSSSGTESTFSTLAIGDQLYRLDVTPVTFKVGFNSVSATSLSVQQGYLYINNQYRFALDTTVNDLDVIVNNTRYDVNQISTSNGRLVIFPGKRKLANVTVADHKYDADFVKLYINSVTTTKFLSDLVVVDENTVDLDGKKYNLATDKVTVQLGTSYYNITKISLSSSGTLPSLSITDPVINGGYTISSISTIFVGTTILNTAKISSVDFIINSDRYRLSEVNIDRSGNFVIGDKTYTCKDSIMIVDGAQYKIENISFIQDKLIIYCATAAVTDMVLINDQYYASSAVKIIKDNIAYELDQVLVISRNLMRIGGKQYSLDSTFKVSFDGKTYKLEQIDYNNTLDMPVITRSTAEATSSQPVKYIFYLGSSVIREGSSNDTLIYTNSKWLTFDQIFISDPSHFTVSGTSYALIGASVKIKNVDYKVVDTAWHGSSQQLDIYLQ